MSEQLSFDRGDGFVALPVGIMDLDLSPGAFRTLVELCRMANLEGYCWPALRQLSERLGRSKSAISGYIAELRDAGLIETAEQRTANGYNYRLKYRVTFWRDWRASLTGTARAKPERRVRPAERLVESKKHSQENQDEQALERLIGQWQRCFDGAPYPSCRKQPSNETLAETQAVLAASSPAPLPPEAILPALRALWSGLHISCSDAVLHQQVRAVAALATDAAETDALMHRIARAWPKHWQNSPNEATFAKLLKSAGSGSRYNRLRVIEGYAKRYTLAQKTLRPPLASCSVGPTTSARQATAHTIYPRI